MRSLRFRPVASRPTNGLALIYDLEGFSRFFNQPDVQDYVPRFLNHVSDAVGACLYGGTQYWLSINKDMSCPTCLPVHEKFLGDGALYIWLDQPEAPITPGFVRMLCNRLWNLKKGFPDVAKRSLDDVPVADVPMRIRFGFARGTIYELASEEADRKEYIGFCINLASRLQKYCPELGFIASARVGLTEAELTKHGYVRTIAKSIQGFPREVIIVDKKEFAKLSPTVRDSLFESV